MVRPFEVPAVCRPIFYSTTVFYSLSVEIRPGMSGLLCKKVMPLKLAGATVISLSDGPFWCLGGSVVRRFALCACFPLTDTRNPTPRREGVASTDITPR